MKHWGWIAVRGNHVETFTLTPRDIRNLADGLFEIYGAEANHLLFYIHSQANSQDFTNVPYEDILNSDLLIHKRNTSAYGYA